MDLVNINKLAKNYYCNELYSENEVMNGNFNFLTTNNYIPQLYKYILLRRNNNIL